MKKKDETFGKLCFQKKEKMYSYNPEDVSNS